ncbi:TfuA-like protein [Mycoplana rhizolycopersici]|uniref:Antibiotic resistance protein n=1 Tax=Mycoplana rhizolycopersici TaxID=2746702 RepID=A0ABX2QKQ6_9HYPH|nr:TfuA-like protein [Rhizobium rhizolycopersici]NVP58373.1 antibiotic resistance protein [Rhizobium rhizolycopersici]
MKVIFAGPSLPDAASLCGASIVVHPPAVQGDILRAILDGASVIGLIDGNFEYTAPVWHKEILYGLAEGVSIFGSSSMGALRAAECQTFGMVGIGEVYQRYSTGETVDDSDVALVHAPAELGYAPLSIPMVNLLVTLEHLVAAGRVPREQLDELKSVAERIFYKERTWESIATAARLHNPAFEAFFEEVRASFIDIKRADALALIHAVANAVGQRSETKPSWVFHSTSMWKSLSP